MERENHFQKEDEILNRYHPDYTADRLRQQMEQSRELGDLEAAASQQRMSALMAAEAERLAELQQRHAARVAQERRLALFMLALIGLFVVMLAAYTLIK